MKNKLILDFDGVFAADMLYDQEGKALKSFPWGIRHAIDMLTDKGFEVYIITGDSTEFGRNITKRFTKNLKIEDIIFVNSKTKLNVLRKRFDLSECIYCGDDIYDIEIFKQTYGILPGGSHSIFSEYVDHISPYTTRDYFFMDMAIHILRKFRYDNVDEEILSECISKETGQQSFKDMLLDKRYNNIFILQQYSMRNHTDGDYNPLLDGNLNLTLHRIYVALSNNENLNVKITIPNNVNDDQFTILKEFIEHIGMVGSLEFVKVPYGKNALENRDVFKDTTNLKSIYLGSDLIITDFSASEFIGTAPVIYNYNISRIKELQRSFVDKFFDDQKKTIMYTDDYVYVLNENQKEYLLNTCESPIDRLTVESTVIVDTDIINKHFFKKQVDFFNRLIPIRSEEKVNETIRDLWMDKDHVFFLPFRLTDECYKFEKILELCKSKPDREIAIIVTNPNDGDLLDGIPENVEIVNIAKEFDNVNKKSLYFSILDSIQQTNLGVKANYIADEFIGPGAIMIPIFEDPELVLHQSLIEMQLLCDEGVNFIPALLHETASFETLLKTRNNNYITKLIYS